MKPMSNRIFSSSNLPRKRIDSTINNDSLKSFVLALINNDSLKSFVFALDDALYDGLYLNVQLPILDSRLIKEN